MTAPPRRMRARRRRALEAGCCAGGVAGPMEVTLLGTGAPWAAQRATLGMWITAPGCAPLLLDTCGGMELARQLRRAGLDRERVENVLVTHQHLDHAGGIPTLYLGLDRFTAFATVETHEGV